MKIAAFVTDFPLHLLCWLCDILDGLAARGVQIDLFLYKAGDPPQFRSGIRSINLSRMAWNGKPISSQSAFSIEKTYSHLFQGGAIEIVKALSAENRYDGCISFESRALLLARIIAENSRCPLIHHSFELYESANPGVWHNEFAEIKRFESQLIGGVDLLLIQDAVRQKEYYRILNTQNRPASTMLLPVAMPPLETPVKPRYWHEKYKLPSQTRVVFYIGQVTAGRFVDRMITAAQSFRPDQQLVVHGPIYNNTAALKQLTDLDTQRRVIFSTEVLPWSQVPHLCASADIGLVFYRSHLINDLTTGRSSDKLARYLQSGIPVVCSDFPSFREGVDRYRFGECCSDFSRIPDLVNRICDDYGSYRNGARKAFEEVYNLDPYLDELMSRIGKIRSDKERIPSVGTTFSPQDGPKAGPVVGTLPIAPRESAVQTPVSPPLAKTPGGDGHLFRFTHQVYLELSNLCNYAHLHKACPAAVLAQNQDILPSRIVNDVLDTLHRYQYRGRIGFHTYNEPLMDPRLTQFTRRARQACPDSEIYICTNGYYLDQTMAEELVETGVNHIHISAYSDSEQRRLEAIRVPVEYHVDRMTLDKRMDAYDNPETDDSRPCYSPLYQIIVTAAGRISLCCMDWKREHCFGDLHKQSFEQAVNDPAMRSLYEQLSKGDRRLSLCKRCHFVRGKAEPEITMNQTPQTGPSVNPGGGSHPQATALPAAPPTPSRPPSPVLSGPRVISRSAESDPNRILTRARELYGAGRYNEAFDLYDQLSVACPQSAVEILAEAYDLYRRIPNSDRYILYQSRYFEFGIRAGEKVLDIGSGNVPFRLATHLADLTTQDHQLGRAGVPFKYLDGKPVIQCDIARMPFADKEFDFAYCSHVLEHVENPTAACKELMRIARRGYIETPSPAKDLWLDTIAVSNHRWAVEKVGDKLVFTEYSPSQKLGLKNNILRDMHCGPQTPREKAFSALVYLKADRMNTMLLWDGSFEFEVRRLLEAGSFDRPSASPAEMRPSGRMDQEASSACGSDWRVRTAGADPLVWGEDQFLQGDCDGAEKTFRKVLEVNPQNLTALNHLAGLYWRTHRKSEAIDCIHRALRINPEDPRTRQNYAALCAADPAAFRSVPGATGEKPSTRPGPLIGGGQYERIYHYHIRKTGGTSRNYMFFALGGGDSAEIYKRICTKPAIPVLSGGKVYVGWNHQLIEKGDYFYAFSHTPAGRLHLPPRTFTFTCLRDPVQRVLSVYKMLKSYQVKNVPHPSMKIEGPYLGDSFTDFLQRAPKSLFLNQLFMFSETYDVQQAAEAIETCSHWMQMEQFDPGIRELSRKLQIELNAIHERKNGFEVQITPREMDSLREVLQPEYHLLEILNQARNRTLIQTPRGVEASPNPAPASSGAPSSGIPVVQGWPLSRIGTDYGGAMIDPELVPIGGTVISAGVGEDISFDLELIRLRDCTVIGIDPTEKAARFVRQNPHPRFQFLQRALTEKGGTTVRMYKSANPDYVSESVVLSHKTVAPEQSYEAQTVCLDDLLRSYPDVSLLKMDIEGAEFAVLNSVRNLEIPQLYIEFHHFCTGYTIHDTMHCIQRLTRMGYVVAHTAAKAAPLQQVTFIHSRCLSERSARQAAQQNQVCAIP